MSWDIYGNPLRRGYCEVHPHVHEEYPCSICMAERNRPQVNRHAHEEFERLQYEFAHQGDYIRHLESERAALAAQVEELQRHIAEVYRSYKDSSGYEPSISVFHRSLDESMEAVSATPQHHLAEIRAEAIEQAATYLSESVPDKSHESVIFKDRYVYISTRYLREYADQIRREVE